MSSSTPVEQALNSMLDFLKGYLPVVVQPNPGDPPPPDPPPPLASLSIVTVSERSVGFGNRRGTETRGVFPAVALKGVRLDALVRFQLWASEPADVETLIIQLQARLQGDGPELRAAGFLKTSGEQTSLAEEVASLSAWRKTFDYRVLYEFHYRDEDDATSLIARIPVDIIGEFNESMLVTDELVRWDKNEAPALQIAGRGRPISVRAISLLAFRPPGWNSEKVTISISMRGNVQKKEFPSVRKFIKAFALEPDTPERPSAILNGNKYKAGQMDFPNADFPDPIILETGDSFEINYASPQFDSEAVVYLKVLH